MGDVRTIVEGKLGTASFNHLSLGLMVKFVGRDRRLEEGRDRIWSMADERGEGSLRMRWRREALRARDLDLMDQSPRPESSFNYQSFVGNLCLP